AAQRSWRAVEGRLKPARTSRLGWFLAGAAMASAVMFVLGKPAPVEPVSVVASVERLELTQPGTRTLNADEQPIELSTPVDVLIIQHATAAVELTATGELVLRVTRGQVYVRGRDRWVSEGRTEHFVATPEVKEKPVVVRPAPKVKVRPLTPTLLPSSERESAPSPVVPEPVVPSPVVPAPVTPELAEPVVVGPTDPPETKLADAARLRAALALRKKDPTAAATELRTLASSAALGEVALYELGRLEAGALEAPSRAVGTFTEARTRFPSGSLRIELSLGLIEALLATGRPAEALHELDALSATSAGAERADELTFLRAQLARATNRHAEAISLLAPLAARSSPFAERALIALADSQTRSGQADAARTALREYLRRFPTGHHAADARRALAP
ncbi:MAG TPA: tetratricopeptide repeat protein, partial [Archangium sp.]